MSVAIQTDRRFQDGRTVALHNGEAVHLRPIRPDDAPALVALCGRLSARSIYQRFFTLRPLHPEEAVALAAADGRDQLAIVAEVELGSRTEVVGVGRYALAGDDPAPEVALLVEDAWQGLGLGSLLLAETLLAGQQRGFTTFHAEILAENAGMLRLLARHADIVRRTRDHGVLTLLFRPRMDSGESAARP